MLQKSKFSIAEADRRTEAIVNEALRKSTGIASPVLFVMEGGEAPYNAHLDAMFAAQQLGWPTVNGYSSSDVPGSEYRSTCDMPARQFAAYADWNHLHQLGPQVEPNELSKRLVFVGWPACDVIGDAQTNSGTRLGPPPEPAAARFVSLVPRSLVKNNSHVDFEIAILNAGDTRLSARSFAPLGVAWRFVVAGTVPESGQGWDHRVQVPQDLRPNGDLAMTLSAELPETPGTYWLEVSLVAEQSFWFHDKGSHILRFAQSVSVP